MRQKTGRCDQEELLNNLFQALQHPVRRRLLFSLLDHNPREPFLVPEDIHDGERELEHLNIDLLHHHLPLLEETGFIEWDRESDELRMGSDFTRIRNPLSALKEQVEADRMAADRRQ